MGKSERVSSEPTNAVVNSIREKNDHQIGEEEEFEDYEVFLVLLLSVDSLHEIQDHESAVTAEVEVGHYSVRHHK